MPSYSDNMATSNRAALEIGSARRFRVYFAFSLALLFAGCGLFEDDEGGVSARSDGIRVTIDNDSEDRVYYAIFGRELATLIDWIPHLDESRSVAPRSSRSIPHGDIMKEDGETEAIFYWWTADVRDGERVPGTLTSTIIDL